MKNIGRTKITMLIFLSIGMILGFLVTSSIYKEKSLKLTHEIDRLQLEIKRDVHLSEEVSFWGHIKEASIKNDVSPYLLAAIIEVESNFNPNARSHAGAIGLMQLMPSTFTWIKLKYSIPGKDIYDPKTNIEVGARYLSYLLNKYEKEEKALAHYNGGYRNAKLYPSKDCATETRNYVVKVLRLKEKFLEI